MEKAITKSALIQTAVAANFAVDANGFVTIKYLPKFNSAWLKLIATGVYRRDQFPSAEAVKVTNVAAVTVTASTKYKLQETTINDFIESWSRQPNFYGYTSPAVLGTNAIENHNMFVSLAYKINNSAGSHATAYPVIRLTHAAGNFVEGEILTGATSGAQGIVLTNVSTTIVEVGLIGSTMYVNGENIDDTSGSGPYAITADPLLSVGIRLRIVDAAGYYTKARGGCNTFTAAAGFSASDVTVQSKLITLTTTAAPALWAVGSIVRGATSGVSAKVIRSYNSVMGAFKVLLAFEGSGTAFTGGENISDGTTTYVESAQAALAAPSTGISTILTVYNAPSFCYSQGQGAALLLDVPVLARDSQNLNSGSFEGPQGDTPVAGTEYVSSNWGINWPVSVDNVGQSTTAIPAPMRLWTKYSQYSSVDGWLDGVGLTN